MEQPELKKVTGPDEQGQSEQEPDELKPDVEIGEDELENITGGRVTNIRGNAGGVGTTTPYIPGQIIPSK